MNLKGPHVPLFLIALVLATGCGQSRVASGGDPALLAQRIQQQLSDAQRTLLRDPAMARAAVDSAVAQHAALAPQLPAPTAAAAQAALTDVSFALTARDAAALAGARADYQAALLWAGYLATLDALRSGDGPTAAIWLKLRAYPQSSRFSPASSSATAAIEDLTAGRTTAERAMAIVRTELDATYRALMVDAVETAVTAAFQGYRARAIESAVLAAGYYRILRGGFADPPAADRAFAALRAAVTVGDWPAIQRARAALAAALAR